MRTPNMMSSVNILCTEVAALFLVRFAECSSYEEHGAGDKSTSTTNKQHVIQINHLGNDHKGFDIAIHGILLWASMGFLMPVGILTMRMSSTMDSHRSRHKILFYVHAVLQVMAVVLVTIGAVLSIRKFENAFNNTHQRIGLALYGAIYLQVLIGFRRPKRGTKYRTAWYFLHWMVGTSTTLVGILNIYTGLQAFHERTSRSTTLWTIIFTTQVSLMTILYLFQDKWEYMQKQGMMPDDDGHDPSDSSSLNEPSTSRKSNALATHFSRTNVLNRLLQQT